MFFLAQVPHTATWAQLRDVLPYDQLKDPAEKPMTAKERQILEERGDRRVGALCWLVPGPCELLDTCGS